MIVVQWLIGFGILMAVGYAGFLGGRDAAERQASATIADLRRANASLRRQKETAYAEAARWHRLANARTPQPPEWLS